MQVADKPTIKKLYLDTLKPIIDKLGIQMIKKLKDQQVHLLQLKRLLKKQVRGKCEEKVLLLTAGDREDVAVMGEQTLLF
jgi:hypothetical protein